jgi:hypothetical protein
MFELKGKRRTIEMSEAETGNIQAKVSEEPFYESSCFRLRSIDLLGCR